jgi:hypothetical protein
MLGGIVEELTILLVLKKVASRHDIAGKPKGDIWSEDRRQGRRIVGKQAAEPHLMCLSHGDTVSRDYLPLGRSERQAQRERQQKGPMCRQVALLHLMVNAA